MRTLLTQKVLVAVLVLAVGACSPDQARQHRVVDRRLPSIEASPPEPIESPEDESFALRDFVGGRIESVRRQARHLRLQLIESKDASRERPGTVLSQDPAAGESVEPGAIVYVVLAAPPSEVDEGDMEQAPEKEAARPGEAPSKFTGVHADNYEAAYGICNAFGLEEVASEFKTQKNPLSAAEGYASQFQPAFQQAPFEGCFDGLTA